MLIEAFYKFSLSKHLKLIPHISDLNVLSGLVLIIAFIIFTIGFFLLRKIVLLILILACSVPISPSRKGFSFQGWGMMGRCLVGMMYRSVIKS